MSATVAAARAAEDIVTALSVLNALQRKLGADEVAYKDLDRLYRGINELRATFRGTVRPSAVGLISYRTESAARSEEHTSELQSLMRISSAVFCLKKKKI